MNILYFTVQQTMYFAVPLLIMAISVMYSEHSGVINIALGDTMVTGAFVGIFFINAFQDRMNGQGLLLLTILIVRVAEGIFSLLHAFAAINTKANQTINDTALNVFAPTFTIFTARIIQGVQQIQFNDTFHIDKVSVLGDIPMLGDIFFKDCYITTYLGILIFIAAAFVIKHTRSGLRLRAYDEHPDATDSVGVNTIKIRYARVIISGALDGIGGLVFMVPTSTNFSANVAGYGFLAIAVLTFGQWRGNKILMAAFFFDIMKTLTSAYSAIPALKSLPIPNGVYKIIPYIITLVILAFLSKASQAPRAEGIPYDKGSR